METGIAAPPLAVGPSGRVCWLHPPPPTSELAQTLMNLISNYRSSKSNLRPLGEIYPSVRFSWAIDHIIKLACVCV